MPLMDCALLFATIVACELAVHMPFGRTLRTVSQTPLMSARIISSKRISDHWKETILPVYACRLMGASLMLLAFILGLSAPYLGVAFALDGDVEALVSQLSSWHMVLLIIVVATVYLWLRTKFRHG